MCKQEEFTNHKMIYTESNLDMNDNRLVSTRQKLIIN